MTIKSRRMRRAGYIVCTVRLQHLVVKLEEDRPIGRPSRRCENVYFIYFYFI
jgi:hypothetical protein